MNDKSLGTHISELKDLILAYVRQEVLGPLKGAGQYVKKGLIGGLVGVLAGILVSLGLLRLAQTADVLDIDRGGWSWLVYLVVGAGLLVIALPFILLGARTRRKG